METMSTKIVDNDGNYELFFPFLNFNGVYTRVTRKANPYFYEVHNFPVN
jgi:hypothetical protein